jgi:hypothetical protein
VTADVPGWLVQEVSDLLDASSVGLYEFIWLLRPAHPDVPDDELRAWANEALRRLLAEHRGRLVWLKWPSEVPVGTVSADNHGEPHDWSDPPADGPYMALMSD